MNDRLYALLARDLHTAISKGSHLPGSMLPGEHELAATHGVSRQTVRAALDLLEKDGLVERRRGAGTFVLESRPPTGFGQSVLSTEELVHYARDTRRTVQSVDDIVADQAVADTIGARPGSHWMRIRSLRIDPQRPQAPICQSYAYVAPVLERLKDHLGDETTALCNLISRHCGVDVDVIDQELQGAIVSKDIADALHAEAGSPALRILRRYRDAKGWVFLTSVGLHPADRFAYRMRLARTRLTG